jgi:hypothetical protein
MFSRHAEWPKVADAVIKAHEWFSPPDPRRDPACKRILHACPKPVSRRAHEVAALERQYYARVLAEMRAENWRAANYRARPVRGGGRRR